MILLNENAAVALLHNNNHIVISVTEHNRDSYSFVLSMM